MVSNRTWSRLVSTGLDLLRAGARAQRRSSRPTRPSRRAGTARRSATDASPGHDAGSATIELDPKRVGDVRLSYAPDHNSEPTAGEIVWTWVPYAEHDGRGKDRPVLVIDRQSADRVYAVKLTSKDKDGDREYIPIGSGPWDSQGRESWVDIDQLYSVHHRGMRREAAALDLDRFTQVALVLQRRFGWQA